MEFSPQRHGGHREEFLFVGRCRQTKIFCPKASSVEFPAQIFLLVAGLQEAAHERRAMKLIGETLFVYRYTPLSPGGHLPIDEKNEIDLRVLGVCGEPDLERKEISIWSRDAKRGSPGKIRANPFGAGGEDLSICRNRERTPTDVVLTQQPGPPFQSCRKSRSRLRRR
jgi:hypothetical protein